LVGRLYGSPQTQNFEDAAAHAQGGESLARAATEQVSAMRQHRRLTHRLPELRLLSIAPGPDYRGQIAIAAVMPTAQSKEQAPLHPIFHFAIGR